MKGWVLDVLGLVVLLGNGLLYYKLDADLVLFFVSYVFIVLSYLIGIRSYKCLIEEQEDENGKD